MASEDPDFIPLNTPTAVKTPAAAVDDPAFVPLTQALNPDSQTPNSMQTGPTWLQKAAQNVIRGQYGALGMMIPGGALLTAAQVNPKVAGVVDPAIINTAASAGGAVLGSGAGPFGAVAGSMAGNAAGQGVNIALGWQPLGFDKGSLAASAIPVPAIEAGGPVLKSALTVGSGLAGTVVQNEIDEGKMPTAAQMALSAGMSLTGHTISSMLNTGAAKTNLAKNMAFNVPRDEIAKQARASGFTVPPAETNPSVLNKSLQSLGGKLAVNQASKAGNSALADQVVAADIPGLNGGPATRDALEAAKQDLYAPYDKIRTISASAAQDLAALKSVQLNSGDAHGLAVQQDNPLFQQLSGHLQTVANADVDGLRAARFASQKAYERFKMFGGGNVADQEAAEQFGQVADQKEADIEKAAQAIGDPELLNQLNASRTQLAKINVISKVTNPDTGEVDPAALARLGKKLPLTGGLQTVAKFAGAFPKAIGKASTTPTAGVSALNPVLGSAAAALVGEHSGVLAGMAAGALPSVIRGGARAAVLSPTYQNGLLSFLSRRSYGVPMMDPAAIMAQYAGTVTPRNIPAYLSGTAPSQ